MMQIRNPSGRRRLLALPVFLFLVFFSFSARSEEAGSGFSLSVPKEVKGYARCEITVQAPSAGEMLLTLYDSLDNPWLYRRESLSDGENILSVGGKLILPPSCKKVLDICKDQVPDQSQAIFTECQNRLRWNQLGEGHRAPEVSGQVQGGTSIPDREAAIRILQDSISWNCQEHESVPHAVWMCEPAHVHTRWQSEGVLLCLPWVISTPRALRRGSGEEIKEIEGGKSG